VTSARIGIVDAHDLTTAGLAHLLDRGPTNGYTVVPLEPHGPAPDVVLYSVDHDEPAGDHDPELHALLRSTPSTVIVTYWDDTSPGIEPALACGAHGALSKKLPVEELLQSIEKIREGRDPEAVLPADGSCHPEIAGAGLTPRELDVLRLVAVGLTNQEIADRLYVSINSVKTYIRTAYRKIGVERRAQAVIWVERHGLTPPLPSVALDIDDVAAE